MSLTRSLAISSACALTCGAAITASASTGTSTGVSGQITADCNDSSSDAATINDAITSSARGSIILIHGTCLLTRPVTLLGDRTYSGGSTTGTTLVQGAPMGYVLASDVYVDGSANPRTPPTTGHPLTVRDLTVKCNGTGTTSGIVLLSWLSDIEHVYVTGCGGSGIVDTNTDAAGVAISNTSVNSRFLHNFIENSGKYGFYVQDSGNSVTDGFFEDNQVSTSGLDGVHVENTAGWKIAGNHLYADAQNGIYASRLFNSTIADNYIEDFGAKQSSGTWYGIEATVQGDVGSAISGNKVTNNSPSKESATSSYVYLAVVGSSYGIGDVAVFGNVIVGDKTTDVGLSFDGGSRPLLVSSTGNRVSGVGTPRRTTATVTLDSGY